MPTSRDVTSGGSLSCTVPECQQLKHPPTPLTNWPSHHCLGHYLKIYMSYVLSKGRSNLCQPWLNRCRNECPRNGTINKKVSFLRKKTRAAKSTKVHFIREILWPEQESGKDSAVFSRPPNNPKIWHKCDRWHTASRNGLDVIPVTLSQTVCHLVSCRVWSVPIRSWGHP